MAATQETRPPTWAQIHELPNSFENLQHVIATYQLPIYRSAARLISRFGFGHFVIDVSTQQVRLDDQSPTKPDQVAITISGENNWSLLKAIADNGIDKYNMSLRKGLSLAKAGRQATEEMRRRLGYERNYRNLFINKPDKNPLA